MATSASLRDRVRLELGDTGMPFEQTFVGDGATDRYELDDKPVSPTGFTLVASDASSPVYTLDDVDGVVLLQSPLAAGVRLTARGSSYRMFSDSQLDTFVSTAVTQHLHHRTGMTLANLPLVEEYPVALLAVVEALFALVNDSSYDIDVHTPEGIGIPRSERFHQLMQMLELRQAQYQQLASALNVGVNRIEMFTLRRVSRTTNRLVPVYETKEFEDNAPPLRLFLPIDTQGVEPAPDTLPDAALAMVMGEPFSATITLNTALAGYTVKATLRRYRNSAAFRWFDVAIVDAVNGVITVALDPTDTRSIGAGPFWWDLKLTDSSGADHFVVEGPVTLEERART